jgi:hypothetical protein
MIRKLTDKQLIAYDKKTGVKIIAARAKGRGADSAPPPAVGGFFARKTWDIIGMRYMI